ncbi:short-chain fatty acyl-CoA regulator family protein [Sphingomonas sp. BAUL-RG-20F-R05-02]|uniref:helix-turn-helix domain-containing protein n=1 Tax=Sphingomonas sp. BAUL-RG-20F-R05-02 TaxID=2914830 RepID=UPI001F5A554E|nr:helix-turn-helix transcriptional regulator [Sphingomonas sp. BAUL-RG-20F-R05-02]
MAQRRAPTFAGSRVRLFRQQARLTQTELASRLGISISYLSQIETDARPLTPAISATLASTFPQAWRGPEGDAHVRLLAALTEAAADPLLPEPLPSLEALTRAVDQQPALVRRFVALHEAWRRAEDRLQRLDDAYDTGNPVGGRLPWDEVRDWFHDAGNYIDAIDTRAEAIGDALTDPAERLRKDHGVEVRTAESETPAALRSFDPQRGLLTLDPALTTESRMFQMTHQLARMELATPIAQVAESAGLRSPEAGRLLSTGLANYAAGAILMPYEAFRSEALSARHDIDRLRRRFGVSFEQACHRLSTLQRPSARGVPFFFCRVDMAGNITKRHSATRLQFARFGGACPLWIVHEAVAIPDRVLVQLAEMPEGTRYVAIAKGLVKESGSYSRSPRRFAITLGCEANHAADFVYADSLDLTRIGQAAPIGVSCRICPRNTCEQRAFPPADRPLRVDPDRRDVVPYRFD